MAHRGRLNVLAHVVGRPYETILREFEGERTIEAVSADPEGGTGDVKYHLGAEGTRTTPAGEIARHAGANPSHLEAVDPVVEGRTRAEQTDRSTRAGVHDPSVALPILIHGDAAFAGQGVVAETLNLAGLAGYSTGGTLHLIANNQVGFTTDPGRGPLDALLERPRQGLRRPDRPRQRRRPRGGDLGDPARARLPPPVRPRRRHRPRRLPALRPQRAGRAGVHAAADGRSGSPSTRPCASSYAERLVDEGVVTAGRGRSARRSASRPTLKAGARAPEGVVRPAEPRRRERPHARARRPTNGVVTAVAAERLRELERASCSRARRLHRPPEARRQLERRARRARARAASTGATPRRSRSRRLLDEGIPIRLTGQDTERGTFSHRHLVLHDAQTGERYAPMQHLAEATASFEVYNSPLSEYACARLRVRLLGRGARGARALGGAVRRLRQRRADHRRPVHRRRPLEVGRRRRG